MENQKERTNHSSKPNHKSEGSSYARISGVTLELLSLNLGIIAGGYFLNEWVGSKIPWFLLLSIFLSVAATIYYLLKKFGS